MTVISKLLNQQGRRKSMILLDEAPTIYIPKLESIPATARSNKVATIYMAQDISQIRQKYGKDNTDAILANLNNQCYGRVGHQETADYMIKLFGKADKEILNLSRSSSVADRNDSLSKSVSQQLQERSILKSQDIYGLKQGEFLGIIVESDEPFFKAKMEYRPELNMNCH